MPNYKYPDTTLKLGEDFFTALKTLQPAVLETKEARGKLKEDIPIQLRQVQGIDNIKRCLLDVIGLKGFKSHRNLWSILFSKTKATTWTDTVAKCIEPFRRKLKIAKPTITNVAGNQESDLSSWRYRKLYGFLVEAKAKEPLLDTSEITKDMSDYLCGMRLNDVVNLLEANDAKHQEFTTAVVKYLLDQIPWLNSLADLRQLRLAWHQHINKLGPQANDIISTELLREIETLFYQRTIVALVCAREGQASPRETASSTQQMAFDDEFKSCFPESRVATIPDVASITSPKVSSYMVCRPIKNAPKTLRQCRWINIRFEKGQAGENILDNVNCRWGVFKFATFDRQKLNKVNFKDAQFYDCSFKGATIKQSKLPLLYIDQMVTDEHTRIDAATLKNLLLEAGKITSLGIYADGNSTGRSFADHGWQTHVDRDYQGEPIRGESMVRQFALQQLLGEENTEGAFTKLLKLMPLATEQEYLALIEALDDLPKKVPGFNLPFTQKRAWCKAAANMKWQLVVHARKQLEQPRSAPETQAEAGTSQINPPCRQNPQLTYAPPLSASIRRDWELDFDNCMNSTTNELHHETVKRTLTPLLQAVLADEYSPLREHRHLMPHFEPPRCYQNIQAHVNQNLRTMSCQ